MLVPAFLSLLGCRGPAAESSDAPAPTETAPPTTPAGCPTNPPLASGLHTLDDQGITRTFELFVPSSVPADAPKPLILVFHGWGGDEGEFLGSDLVRAQADARGYVVAAPRGLGSGPPDQRYNSWRFSGSDTGLRPDGAPICDPSQTPDYRYPSCSEGSPAVAQSTCSWTHCQADDVAFVLNLVAHLEANLCIDPARVFATGGSNGGMFTWELGQRTADTPVFAAIAPLIGLPHAGYLDANPTLPVLLVTGTTDTTVPPGAWDDPSPTTTTDGDRYDYTGATAITQAWAAARGCDVGAPASPFDDGEPVTDCRTYCPADGGWPSVLDCRAQMGHTYNFTWSWPLTLDFFDAAAAR